MFSDDIFRNKIAKEAEMVKISFDIPQRMYELAQDPSIADRPHDLCFACPFRNQTCDGPNCLAMRTERLIEWNNRLSKLNGVTRAEVAEASGIPLPTINSIMSGRTEDPRLSTMRAITKANSGGSWGFYPCHLAAQLIQGQLVEDLEYTIQGDLERANREILDLQSQIVALNSALSAAKDNNASEILFLRQQIGLKDEQSKDAIKTVRRKDKIIGVLFCVIAALVIAVITTLFAA